MEPPYRSLYPSPPRPPYPPLTSLSRARPAPLADSPVPFTRLIFHYLLRLSPRPRSDTSTRPSASHDASGLPLSFVPQNSPRKTVSRADAAALPAGDDYFTIDATARACLPRRLLLLAVLIMQRMDG